MTARDVGPRTTPSAEPIYSDPYTRIEWLHQRINRLENALRAICTANDSGPWIDVYREAGGGYEGLQAIAERALDE